MGPVKDYSMTKVFAGLVIMLFSFSKATAQSNEWDIELKRGESITSASIEKFQDDTLTIVHRGDSSKVWIESIMRISRSADRSNLATRIITGMLVGAGSGFILGLVMDIRENPTQPYDAENNMKMYTAVSGGALGSTIAFISHLDRQRVSQLIELQEMGPGEKKNVLSSLLEGKGTVASATSSPRLSYGFRVGPSIPVGSFGKTPGDNIRGNIPGAAKFGISAGGELNFAFSDELSWTSSLMLSSNTLDESAVKDSISRALGSVPDRTDIGSWFCAWPMTGLRFNRTIAPDIMSYLDIQIGIFLGSSPEINIPNYFHMLSSTSTGFAFGIGGGLLVKEKLRLYVQYLRSDPEYTLKDTGGGWSESRRQPTGLVQITAGWVL